MFLSLHPRPATFWVVDRAHTLLDYIRCFSHFPPPPPFQPATFWVVDRAHTLLDYIRCFSHFTPQPATFWVVDRAHTLLDYIRCFSHFTLQPATFWVVDRDHTLLDYIRCFSHFTPQPATFWVVDRAHTLLDYIRCFSHFTPQPATFWVVDRAHTLLDYIRCFSHFTPQPATFWVVDRAHTLLDYIRCFSHFTPGPPLSGWSIEPIHYSIVSDVSLTPPPPPQFQPATFWVVDRAHTLLDYIRCFSHFTPGPPLSGWSIEPIHYSIISDVSLTPLPPPPLPARATFWVVDRAHTLLDYIRCFSHFTPSPPLPGWSIEPIHYSIISDVSLNSPRSHPFLIFTHFSSLYFNEN